MRRTFSRPLWSSSSSSGLILLRCLTHISSRIRVQVFSHAKQVSHDEETGGISETSQFDKAIRVLVAQLQKEKRRKLQLESPKKKIQKEKIKNNSLNTMPLQRTRFSTKFCVSFFFFFFFCFADLEQKFVGPVLDAHI